MEKQRADTLISEYRNKIFGFALEKMRNISQAEELASDIVCEVYSSFLKVEEIVNPDGYVYRIASNVYANYIKRLKGSAKTVDISEIILPFYDDSFEHCEYAEDMQRLRDEIGFLSERQRKIIYMHYYENKSVSEIAGLLGISAGTVKWHLSDARSALKEELTMEKYNDDLALNPIRFSSMGHGGYTGSKGDTADMFNTRLKQNIAWSCYYTPLTAEEIARKLNVPCAYVADEIKLLEEYGYLDRLDNGKNPKFRTNMYITDVRLFDDTENKLLKEAAVHFCDELYTKVFADFDNSADNWGLSCDGNDKNFMKYSLVMLCMNYAWKKPENFDEEIEKFAVKRPDGGCFISYAVIEDDSRTTGEDPYWRCGYMTLNEDGKYENIQCDCRFSDRSELRWRDNLNSDWDSLYSFIKSGCDKNALEPESYKRLCDKGYIINDRVQVILTNKPMQEIISENVSLPDSLKAYSDELDRKCYEQGKDKYPEHMRPLVKLLNTGKLNSSGQFLPFLIETMLEKGMLLPLSDIQKKSVFSVMSYDQ